MSQTGLPSPPQQTTPTTEPDVQQSPSSQAPASASTPAPPAPQPPPPPPPPPPPAVASPQTDAPNDNNISLHNVITAITTAASSTLLNQNLKTFTPSKEIREVIFASFLPDGHDPLTVLDIQANTLGILYIL
ncbi:hypothetical protein ID866_10905 [Astraeus odoratus]|nr:hypothetical protein ID866_10905 [Astraeus odoratus]